MVEDEEESPVSGSGADLLDEMFREIADGVEDRGEVDGGDSVGFDDGELGAVVGGLDEGRIELVEVSHGGKFENGKGNEEEEV